MKETISEVLTDATLAAGDIILVHESAYSVAVANDPAAEIPGFDPLLTTYAEDITYPGFDVEIQVALFNPGIGNVVEIQGTGMSSVVTFPTLSNTRASLLEGFTIKGGVGDLDVYVLDPVRVGGGIRCLGATPTIRDCRITDNTATLGGGIFASIGSENGDFQSGPLVEDCLIESNQCLVNGAHFEASGGGLFSIHCSPEIRRTEFMSNFSTATGGGVTFMNQSLSGPPPVLAKGFVRPILDECHLHDNVASQKGGGVFAFVAVNPQIRNSLIRYNVAGGSGQGVGDGGGLYWDNCKVELDTCHIAGNTADIAGGGILFEGEGDVSVPGFTGFGPSPSSITHCTIERNVATEPTLGIGGGVCGRLGSSGYYTQTRFENCLIANNTARNEGGGMHLTEVDVKLQNCTVTQNLVRSVTSLGFTGGILFDQGVNPNSRINLHDSIIDGNRSLLLVPPSPWQVDFFDGTLTGPPPVFLTYCMMSKAAGYAVFAFGMGNIVARADFASGPTSKYFPNGSFYLSHSPEQSSTSQAYNSGSAQISALFAVNGMQCRTLMGIVDVGIVDMGFHYPNGLVGLP